MDIMLTARKANLYGSSRSLRLLLDGLDNRGFEVGLCSAVDGPLVEYAREEEFPTAVIGRNIERGYGFLNSRRFTEPAGFIKSQYAQIQKWTPAVTYVNNTQPAVLLAAALSDSETVYHVREPGLPTGSFLQGVRRLIGKFAPERYIAVSHAVEARLIDQGVPADQIEVTWNGTVVPSRTDIDQARYRGRHSWSLDGEHIVIGSAGRLHPTKGIADFLEGLQYVDPAIRQNLLVLIAGGPTDSDYAKRLRKLSRESGIGSRIRFLGVLREMEEFYASVDMVITPSTYMEPFGRTVIEAMSYGQPVIGTAVGGMKETIQDGETGILLPPGKPEYIGKAIQKLASDSGGRESMGKRGRERVKEEFSAEKYVDNIASIISSAVSAEP